MLQANRVGRDQQLAAPGARTGGAILAMVGHGHFHLQLAHRLHLVRPRHHVRAFNHRRVAGRHIARRRVVTGVRPCVHLDEADTACPRRVVDVVEFAQRRDMNVVAARDVEDRFVGTEFDFTAVDVGVHG